MKEIAAGVFIRRSGKVSMTKSGRRLHLAKRMQRVHVAFKEKCFPEHYLALSKDPRKARDRILGTPTLRAEYDRG